ncbi:hypothetical protein J2W69_002558 [Rheinheimera soli]|uniref:Uncharacterized protein n=1 Tax=Rheinheimera soli TaxID=443616 RepID=A0ABU1W0V9_9GAMM|nr:hypothetical protein [Rheinheimera soli]
MLAEHEIHKNLVGDRLSEIERFFTYFPDTKLAVMYLFFNVFLQNGLNSFQLILC